PPAGRAGLLATARRPFLRPLHHRRLVGQLRRPLLPRRVVPLEIRGVPALRRAAPQDRAGVRGGLAAAPRRRRRRPAAPRQRLGWYRGGPLPRPLLLTGVNRPLPGPDRHRQGRLSAGALRLVQRPRRALP